MINYGNLKKDIQDCFVPQYIHDIYEFETYLDIKNKHSIQISLKVPGDANYMISATKLLYLAYVYDLSIVHDSSNIVTYILRSDSKLTTNN